MKGGKYRFYVAQNHHSEGGAIHNMDFIQQIFIFFILMLTVVADSERNCLSKEKKALVVNVFISR